MKRFSSSVLLSAVFAVSQFPNAQAQSCVFTNERAAFELVALKNTLMVAALSCGENNEYNDFMTRFQPYLATQQAVMDRYFQRMNGGTARSDEDNFLTSLSNEESQESLSMGPQYCPGAGALFDQILSLRDEGALKDFAAANAPAQGGPDICGAAQTAAPALPPPEPVELPTPPAAGPAPGPAPAIQASETQISEPQRGESQAGGPQAGEPQAGEPQTSKIPPSGSRASIAQRASAELVVSPYPAWHPPAKLERAPLAAPPGVQVAQAGKPAFTFPRRLYHEAIPARHVPTIPAIPASPAKPSAKPAVTIVQI